MTDETKPTLGEVISALVLLLLCAAVFVALLLLQQP